MSGIRVSAKAVIVRDGKILLTKNVDPWGVFYLLPGGGQEPGEPLTAALRRECREEIGSEVRVGELLFVREYIARNHEFAEHEPDLHQIEMMFECELAGDRTPRMGPLPDAPQVAVEWVDLDRIEEVRLYPKALTLLLRSPRPGHVVYMGDVN